MNAIAAIDQTVLRRSWLVALLMMAGNLLQLLGITSFSADAVAGGNLTGAGVLAVAMGAHVGAIQLVRAKRTQSAS